MKNQRFSRREVAGSLGLLFTGGFSALAGCSGSDSNEKIGPVYESDSSGSSSDEDGTEITLFDGNTLGLYWADLTKEDGIIAIRGKLLNNQPYTLDNVRIEAQFLNADDEVLDQSLAVVQNLGGKQVWKFEVPYPGSRHDEIASGLITNIVSY